MSDTMRTRVLKALKAHFVAMDETQPAGDPMGWEFSVVSTEPLGALPKGKKAALGIYGGGSDRKPRYPFADVALEIVMEVHVSKVAGTNMTESVESALGAVERHLKAGGTFGGLVSTVDVTGDQTNVEGQHDNEADGALFLIARYSQREDDPRKNRGE